MKSRRTPIAVVLAALAFAVPTAAQARPTAEAGWTRLSEQEQQILASRGQGSPQAFSAVAPAPARTAVSTDSGVDWASAALGAGGGIALATLAVFGFGAAGDRRVRTAR